ncbi:hypothetical protein EVAR_33374_1 [Eumeta japonica]|uniref:Uncharacterized protein n=1 Tax=Eumeta variegata TaxID=151549 RepID=A0A4C1X0E9_EUMVA|nr:hypothetical protein EVAR_33374_1 [Eumeta japonica]
MDVMHVGNVAQNWLKRFQSGNFDVKDELHSGRLVTDIVWVGMMALEGHYSLRVFTGGKNHQFGCLLPTSDETQESATHTAIIRVTITIKRARGPIQSPRAVEFDKAEYQETSAGLARSSFGERRLRQLATTHCASTCDAYTLCCIIALWRRHSPRACRSQAAGERGNNSVDREFRLDNEMTQL